MPAYPQILEQAPSLREALRLGNPLGCGEMRILETSVPKSKLVVWLVGRPAFIAVPAGFTRMGTAAIGRMAIDVSDFSIMLP